MSVTHVVKTSIPRRAWTRARQLLSGMSAPVLVLYLISTIFNLLAFAHGDLNHTVGSSYAYLLGHGLDFYDYNKQFFQVNDYLPVTYLIFAAWMAPVKLILSPGMQFGLDISPTEVVWAKVLLLLVFWATFYVVSLIAKELFPARPNTQTTVRIAFILSPFAAFAFNIFGQYDIIGVFFASLGFLFFLRGDKWRFAIFMGLSISCKYFAIAIFLPLLVLQFKRVSDMAKICLVAGGIVLVQILFYLPNQAFRSVTLFGHAGQEATSAVGSGLTYFVVFVYLIGLILLWRIRPTQDTLGPLAVQASVLAYGLVLTAVAWHPQWFILMAPFVALSLGYLRRPAIFLIWESVAFIAFIWLIVHQYAGNVDVTLVRGGGLRGILGPPHLLLGDLYPDRGVNVVAIVVMFYLISPSVFALFQRLLGRPDIGDPKVPTGIWVLRVLTVPIAWTIPSLIALWIPLPLAQQLDPAAPVIGMTSITSCSDGQKAIGPISSGDRVTLTFVARDDQLGAISVSVATYGQQATGELHMTLQSHGSTVRTSTAQLRQVKDDGPAYLVFDTIKKSKGATYTAILTTTPGSSNIAYLGGADDQCDSRSSYQMDDVDQKGDLALTQFNKIRYVPPVAVY